MADQRIRLYIGSASAMPKFSPTTDKLKEAGGIKGRLGTHASFLKKLMEAMEAGELDSDVV